MSSNPDTTFANLTGLRLTEDVVPWPDPGSYEDEALVPGPLGPDRIGEFGSVMRNALQRRHPVDP